MRACADTGRAECQAARLRFRHGDDLADIRDGEALAHHQHVRHRGDAGDRAKAGNPTRLIPGARLAPARMGS